MGADINRHTNIETGKSQVNSLAPGRKVPIVRHVESGKLPLVLSTWARSRRRPLYTVYKQYLFMALLKVSLLKTAPFWQTFYFGGGIAHPRKWPKRFGVDEN